MSLSDRPVRAAIGKEEEQRTAEIASPASENSYTLGSYRPKEIYDNPQEDGTTDLFDGAAYAEEKLQFILHPQPGVPPEGDILDHDIDLLHSAHHADPFAVLGPHTFKHMGDGCIVFRAWIKDALTCHLRMLPGTACRFESAGEWVQMHPRCEWLFQVCFSWKRPHDGASFSSDDLLTLTKPVYEYKVTYRGDENQIEYMIRDAYSFECSLPSKDLLLFQSGSCWHVDNLMGSHILDINGASGVRFGVWAPNAVSVSLVGDFNQWDGRAHPMRKRHEYGVWELFVPSVTKAGQTYGYKIQAKDGSTFVKIDAYAQEFEDPPAYASVISSDDDAYKPTEERYQWGDSDWMCRRRSLRDEMARQPISIYEVHLPSWMRGDGNTYLTYRELAHRLVEHCQRMNFTHVEFLPLAQHPFEGSWGYQVSGFYAPYSRLGKPDDLKYLIDKLHRAGLGVFVDFVPAHFVKDSWGLVHYDGEPCYEYADPREGEHRTWGTMVFNYRRNEVRSFLLGAAYHWLRRYHIDGLRIDAVSSMLYKNYCRDEGDWLPNEYGGDANLEAINMLQELNWVVHREFPGVFMMAEEATSWRGVSDKKEGLGFDAKWDLGWMNDTLSYLCTPTPLRPTKHGKLTFRGLYMAHEAWVLPLSHDEVVSGKGSLLDKCGFAGSPFDERLSTMKALITYQIGLGGRPLIFMGGEFAQGREWNESRSLDWHEAAEEQRSKFSLCLADLLGLYRDEPALHKGDDDSWNFKWTECDNAASCCIAWMRHWMAWTNDVLVVCNFGPDVKSRFPIGVPHGGRWRMLLNTDDWKYGGQMRGVGNGMTIQTTQGGRLGWPYCLWLDIPPFSALVIKAPLPAGCAETKPNVQDEIATEASLAEDPVPRNYEGSDLPAKHLASV